MTHCDELEIRLFNKSTAPSVTVSVVRQSHVEAFIHGTNSSDSPWLRPLVDTSHEEN